MRRGRAVTPSTTVDETYVKVAGTWRYVYRAVDQSGQITRHNPNQRNRARSALGNSAARSPHRLSSVELVDVVRKRMATDLLGDVRRLDQQLEELTKRIHLAVVAWEPPSPRCTASVRSAPG